MYVRIYWSKVKPAFWENMEQNQKFLMNTDIPGLLARIVTQDVADPESIFTFLVWADQDSVHAWENSDEYRSVYTKTVQPYIQGSQTVSLCEVKAANLEKLAKAIIGSIPEAKS